MSDSAAAYDATPYPRLAHRHTHPGHLAALATLLGLGPASLLGLGPASLLGLGPASLLGLEGEPPARARILEIGCASGSNLIPMALTMPNAAFLGIDISPRQIERARADAAAFALPNIRFETLDLAALDARPDIAPGPFDYILAHGLYSWIDAPARDALLRACAALLSPRGVAFVSYNCYPGWHSLEALRRMMLYHTRAISHPAEIARRATALLDLLARALPAERSPQGAIVHSFRNYLAGDGEDLRAERAAYLLHDHLEQENHPVYFHEFADHAGDHGLQYLCDAELPLDFAQGFAPGVAEEIGLLASSLVELQQYMDFARFRMFRKTLLCRAEVEITRALRPERLRGLWLASPAVPEPSAEEPPPLRSAAVERFRTRAGVSVSTDHPLSKAALRTLVRAWPAAFAFDELVRAAAGLLRAAEPEAPLALTDADVGQMALTLLRAAVSSEALVELSALPPRYAAAVGERPVGWRWARRQLEEGGLLVTNLRHERVELEPLEAEILRLLDGTRSAADLVELLAPAVRAGEIVFREGDAPAAEAEAAPALLPAAVAARLRTLARAALLEEPVIGDW